VRTAITLALTAAFALGAAGCGAGAVTAARYSSAQQVIAALDHGGMRCTGGSDNTPVVSGATSESSCNLSASDSPLIDVFPGTVTTAMVLRNSISTGTQKIWSDVGPNWWIQTTRAYANRIQKLLGGRVIGGPWHPPSVSQPAPAATTQDPAVTVCQQFAAIYSPLSSDLNSDANDPSALSPDSTLNQYGDQMAHWSYVVGQAISAGTTSAGAQFTNDLADAGTATVQVAEPLPGVTPDVQSAILVIDIINGYCSGLAG
jgi:hypothetical protein